MFVFILCLVSRGNREFDEFREQTSTGTHYNILFIYYRLNACGYNGEFASSRFV